MKAAPEVFKIHPQMEKASTLLVEQTTHPLSKEATIQLTLRILQTILNQQMTTQPLYSTFEDRLPLPLGDLIQSTIHPVIMTMPYRQMLYSYLLRLHPLHPQGHEVGHINHHLTKGPVAQLFLLLRKIVHLHLDHSEIFTLTRFPPTLRAHFLFIKNMLSLNQWKSLLTVLMPSLALPPYPSVWVQVSRILESMLSEVTEWILSSESGMTTQDLLEKPRKRSLENTKWQPSNLFTQTLTAMEGHIWKVPEGYRIKLPCSLWEKYRNNSNNMTTREIHDFKQLAWAYFCQFDISDLQQAVGGAVFFTQLKSISQFRHFIRDVPAHFVHIATNCGAHCLV